MEETYDTFVGVKGTVAADVRRRISLLTRFHLLTVATERKIASLLVFPTKCASLPHDRHCYNSATGRADEFQLGRRWAVATSGPAEEDRVAALQGSARPR